MACSQFLYDDDAAAWLVVAVVLLLEWWVCLTYVGVRLVKRRPYLMLLVSIVAASTWFGVMVFSDLVLGRTA